VVLASSRDAAKDIHPVAKGNGGVRAPADGRLPTVHRNLFSKTNGHQCVGQGNFVTAGNERLATLCDKLPRPKCRKAGPSIRPLPYPRQAAHLGSGACPMGVRSVHCAAVKSNPQTWFVLSALVLFWSIRKSQLRDTLPTSCPRHHANIL
jgi:hypothetical protein